MSTSTTERRSWAPNRVLTPDQVKARKQFVRKQKTQNVVLAAILIPVIAVFSIVTVVAALVFTFAIPIVGVIAIGFGLVDMVTNGFNIWALIWVAVGVILVAVFRPRIITK